MKSGTSSYKAAWLKKNIVRFAPFWALYTLCLLLGLTVMANGRDGFYYIMNLSQCARMMAVVNLGYALLTAQLLFGDLYNSRMCFGLHALPIRREEIFSVNVLSGLLFSLVPTLAMTLIALPMAYGSGVNGGALIPLLWFAAANLQYLFFFSLAVLCVFLAGNRFSMAVLYAILNFISLLVYLLAETVYMPLMPGVSNPYEWFRVLCPAAKIAGDPLLLVERLNSSTPGTYEIQGGSWLYLLILSAVAVGLLLLSLELYRKRSLETAGEFIAVKALKPVFLVLFAIFGAMGLNLVTGMFFGRQPKTVLAVSFAAVGLAAGWFVGLMLLERTARVFSKKALLGLGTLFLLSAASLLLVRMDPFHIVSWVPETDQVEAVYLIPGYDNFGTYWTDRENNQLTEKEELETVAKLHSLAISEGLKPEDARWYYESLADAEDGAGDPGKNRLTVPLSLEYHLKDGKIRRRFYYVYGDGEAGTLAEKLLSRPAAVLENAYLLDSQEPASMLSVNGFQTEEKDLTADLTAGLLEALKKDMEEGNLAQLQEFHPVPVYTDGEIRLPCLYLSMGFGEEYWNNTLSLDIYSDSIHTLQWLQDHGILAKAIETELQYA